MYSITHTDSLTHAHTLTHTHTHTGTHTHTHTHIHFLVELDLHTLTIIHTHTHPYTQALIPPSDVQAPDVRPRLGYAPDAAQHVWNHMRKDAQTVWEDLSFHQRAALNCLMHIDKTQQLEIKDILRHMAGAPGCCKARKEAVCFLNSNPHPSPHPVPSSARLKLLRQESALLSRLQALHDGQEDADVHGGEARRVRVQLHVVAQELAASGPDLFSLFHAYPSSPAGMTSSVKLLKSIALAGDKGISTDTTEKRQEVSTPTVRQIQDPVLAIMGHDLLLQMRQHYRVAMAQLALSETQVLTLPASFLTHVKVLVLAAAKQDKTLSAGKWTVPKLRKHLNGVCRFLSRLQRWTPLSHEK